MIQIHPASRYYARGWDGKPSAFDCNSFVGIRRGRKCEDYLKIVRVRDSVIKVYNQKALTSSTDVSKLYFDQECQVPSNLLIPNALLGIPSHRRSLSDPLRRKSG